MGVTVTNICRATSQCYTQGPMKCHLICVFWGKLNTCCECGMTEVSGEYQGSLREVKTEMVRSVITGVGPGTDPLISWWACCCCCFVITDIMACISSLWDTALSYTLPFTKDSKWNNLGEVRMLQANSTDDKAETADCLLSPTFLILSAWFHYTNRLKTWSNPWKYGEDSGTSDTNWAMLSP